VYDVQSVSGAATVSFTYRYNDAFSIAVGAAFFMGSEQFVPMAERPIGPPGNRLGSHAYENSIEPGFSVIRDRDELWLRLRYTF